MAVAQAFAGPPGPGALAAPRSRRDTDRRARRPAEPDGPTGRITHRPSDGGQPATPAAPARSARARPAGTNPSTSASVVSNDVIHRTTPVASSHT